MTRIDFYVLPQTGETGNAAGRPREDAVITACKLCDKSVQAGSRAYVFAPLAAQADALDAALWSFRQGSFIAHERFVTGAQTMAAPLPMVLIGAAEPPPEYTEVMINLDAEVPPFFSRFERVLEIVDGDAAARAQSRTRFKFYRDRGYELGTHEL